MRRIWIRRVGLCALAGAIWGGWPGEAAAVGDAATRFNVFVPPNNNNASRRSILIVTNTSPNNAAVDIIDDGADGDTDDTVTGLTLARGQSYVIRMADGAVNDDVGGAHDGDYFRISSDTPVVVQMASHSNWQHDWAPAEGGGSLGNNFFIYAPPTSGADNDLNIYSYTDATEVTIRQMSSNPTTGTGLTDVNATTSTVLSRVTLHRGEDLQVRENGLGLDVLDPGHTYWIQSSNPVSVQYGHLGQVTGGNQARDGAGFVPSANGSSTGSLFYFGIPHNPGRESEKELRVVCPDAATVSLYGTNAESIDWTLIGQNAVAANGHLDFVGANDATFRNADLYQLTVDPPWLGCSVFEGNWMETGSYGTSDFASGVSSLGGTNLGHQFVAYMGPPGIQNSVTNPVGEQTNNASPSGGYASHLYVYGRADNTDVTVYDVDTSGAVFEHSFTLHDDEYYDVVIDSATFNAMNSGGNRPYVRLDASQQVMVMNGNFNDNWMAYFHSVTPQTLTTELSVTSDDLTCGDQVGVTIDCGLSDGTLDDLSMTLSMPDGMSYVAASGSWGEPTSSGQTLSWSVPPPAAGQSTVLTADVTLDCNSVACVPFDLQSMSAVCSGNSGSEVLADIDSDNIHMADTDVVEVVTFDLLDDPDYLGSPPDPGVDVSFSLQGGLGSTVRLLRAGDDPNVTAPQTELGSWVVTDVALQNYSVRDSYTLHYEETRYYRLEITDGGCVTDEGPFSVRTSSGSSGGEDSGLESNGRLAWQLARRAAARSDRKGWLMPETLAALDASAGFREANLLQEVLPATGPRDSYPVNVTPGDLPALTNALAVASADYMGQDGTRQASTLVVETRGEVYEHSKALCDRAGGSRIDRLEHTPMPNGSLIRSAFSNARDATGEYAVEAKLYEESDGSWTLHSAWLGTHYPEPRADQRVLNLQTWSRKPGYALTLFEDIVDPMGVTWAPVGERPSSYLAQATVLGSEVHAELRGQGADDLRLVAQVRRENGELELVDLGDAVSGITELDVGLSTELTLSVVDADERTVDEMWLSDGTWTVLDDSMWGGGSEITSFSPDACPERPATEQGALALSGCAHLEANLEQFAGVARHLGGGRAPLDATGYGAMRVYIQSSQPTRACLERMEGEGAEHPCVRLPAYPDGRWVTVDLSAARRLDTCEPIQADGIHLVSFTATAPGPLELSVGGLTLVPSSADAESGLPCAEGPGADEPEATAGCGCRQRPGGDGPAALLLMFAALGWARRRR